MTMVATNHIRMAAILAIVGSLLFFTSASRSHSSTPADDKPSGPILMPGNKTPEEWVLPNGRLIHPVGKHALAGYYPLGLALTPDGKSILIVNSGDRDKGVRLFSTSSLKELCRKDDIRAYHGVAVSPDGKFAWVCEAQTNRIERLKLTDDQFDEVNEFPCAGQPVTCYASPDGKKLYVVCRSSRLVRIFDTDNETGLGSMPVGVDPFAMAISSNGLKGYVANRMDSTVTVLDLRGNRALKAISVGGQPSAVAVTPDGKRVVVANSNTDNLTHIDIGSDQVLATTELHPYPLAPSGAIPTSLAFTDDGKYLFVALAGLNAVAMLSTDTYKIKCLLPTASYPTEIGINCRNRAIYVACLKGYGGEPKLKQETRSDFESGVIQKIEYGNEQECRSWTEMVGKLNGYDVRQTGVDSLPLGIKHVVFVLREGRSYDELMGDYARGNGLAELCAFDANVTPNLRALASLYSYCDNMYSDGDNLSQSIQWAIGAYCPDEVMKNPDASTLTTELSSYPAAGYMIDHCLRNGISCRMYGCLYRKEPNGSPLALTTASISKNYPPFNTAVTDIERVRVWQREIDAGIFPTFTLIHLANDRTGGFAKGIPTPRAMVADNDLATGLLIQTLSNRPDWSNTVVFITEAGSGDAPDHVDAHRVPLIVAGGRVATGAIVKQHCSFGSIYKTIEKLLGMRPMSQFDDLSTPIQGIWTTIPNLRPYAVTLNRIPLDEKN